MRKFNVNSAMPRAQRTIPLAKRVPPPAVPTTEIQNKTEINTNCASPGTDITESVTTEDGGFMQQRDSPTVLSVKEETEFNTVQSNTGNFLSYASHCKSPTVLNSCSNNLFVTQNAFTFPILGQRNEPLTHRAAVYYHQQLALQEDQGIDLTQSPGRDSPGSSSGSAGSGSRHSTASLDSGRASSYIASSGTASARGTLSSPRCSVSSCSIGSVDRMSQRSDSDIINDWLIDIKFEEYISLFYSAGYDITTIARMTPEDLTAIGIRNPQHREKIKQHIDSLQVSDGLPSFVPGSIEEWLRLLRLDEYIHPLLEQNYKTVRDVTQVTWEDLEDIGIVKLGHQKKILLAIKRVKDIISGKWKIKTYNNNQIRHPRGKSLESLEDLSEHNIRTHLTFSHYSTDYNYMPQHNLIHPAQQFEHQNHKICDSRKESARINPNFSFRVESKQWRRSYEDGDIVPANDINALSGTSGDIREGGGTLPRQRSGLFARCGILERNIYTLSPVNIKRSNNSQISNTGIQEEIASPQLMTPSNYKCFAKPDNLTLMSNSSRCITGNSPTINKKVAPDPPRRQCSMRQTGRSASLQESIMISEITNVVMQENTSYIYPQQKLNIGNSTLQNQEYNTKNATNLQEFQQLQNCHRQQLPSTQPIYVNYSNIHQTKAEVYCEQSSDSKPFQSNSSIDSIDTLPFANENTGTIKQRLLNRQDISSSLSLSSSSCSSSSSTNTVDNITQSFHSLKSSGSLHETSVHGLIGDVGCLIGVGSLANIKTKSSSNNIRDFDIIKKNEKTSPNASCSPSDSGDVDNTICSTYKAQGYTINDTNIANSAINTLASSSLKTSTGIETALSTKNFKTKQIHESVNVLNDIGNMLANLTDELDAMLEEEKRVGISDSE